MSRLFDTPAGPLAVALNVGVASCKPDDDAATVVERAKSAMMAKMLPGASTVAELSEEVH